jgi:peroxiredoxin Q/BCP
MLSVGSDAPAFSAQDQDGNTVSLSGLSGKWIAMWWYPKASTPG